jgi:hypothetical protein
VVKIREASAVRGWISVLVVERSGEAWCLLVPTSRRKGWAGMVPACQLVYRMSINIRAWQDVCQDTEWNVYQDRALARISHLALALLSPWTHFDYLISLLIHILLN